MSEHSFNLALPIDMLRKLSKADYRKTMRYLRVCRNEIEKAMDWDEIRRKMVDAAVFGVSKI